jgi:hypothetical protein
MLIESFKSPFFNLLAIANLILIATAFSLPPLAPRGTLTIALNLPALVVSRILAGPLYQSFVLVPPLVYLQWIFIGAFAKLIASHFKLKTD